MFIMARYFAVHRLEQFDKRLRLTALVARAEFVISARSMKAAAICKLYVMYSNSEGRR